MKPTVIRFGTLSLLAFLILSIGLHTWPDAMPAPEKTVSSSSHKTTAAESKNTASTTSAAVTDTAPSQSFIKGGGGTSLTTTTVNRSVSGTSSRPSGSGSSTTASSARPQTPDKAPVRPTVTSTATQKPAPAPTPTPAGKAVVGYYTGWSAYKGYTPSQVPAGQLTHLNYAFAKINPSTSRIVLADPANDRQNFAAIRALKKQHNGLKALLSVGGWDYSTYFSDVASTAGRREAFAQSCVDMIREHGFDGVDLDWEYPVSGGLSGNTNRPQDKQNFTLLLQKIREKLNAMEKQDGRRYYLTIAGAANTSYLAKIEPQKVAALVDHIFVMAYDMHGPWDRYADFNAPLYNPTEQSPQYKNSVHDGLSAYRSSGVPAGKLVLGMPLYGYIYQGVSSQNNGLYSSFSSAKSISYDLVRRSYLNNSAYKQYRHKTAQVPYLYGKGTFISYEDTASIAAKGTLAKSMGLAGVGVWELSHDTSGRLLNSAYGSLR